MFFSTTHILSQNITPATSVFNLGAMFDVNFNFKQHISKTCRCCFYYIRNLHHMHRFISLSVAKIITTALVNSRLDYCNFLLYNTANKDIAKLQRIKNFFGKGSHAFSLFFLLGATSEIIALASCALSHYFQDLCNSLSSSVITTTSISEFDAHSSKKFQTPTINQF